MSISKLFASAATAALLIGLAAGSRAQAADPAPQQQASAPATTQQAPPLPLGQNDIREVQNQLIALGYNPGPADGQIGPSTAMAVQQYDAAHGGNGQAPIDGALLARLKADTGPRLTYEQVAERSQMQTSAPAAASNQLGGIAQQIVPLIGAAIANSNNNGYYGPGPGYYGPPPGYYGYGYGGY
jgi:hypothetical protein